MAKAAPAPDAPAAEEAAPTGRSRSTKIKIAGAVLGIVVLEWAVAYMVLPGSAATSHAADASEEEAAEHSDSHDEPKADHGSSHGAKHDHGHGAKHEHGHGAASKGEKLSDHAEVDLGQFAVTGYQPVSSSTQYISFHLYGTTDHKHSEEFARRFEENKHRIRDHVIVIIRSAEITDLTDAGLGLIKRRILETTNKTLGKPLLQGVIFSEFSFVEQ